MRRPHDPSNLSKSRRSTLARTRRTRGSGPDVCLSLGDLVTELHDRALARGMSEADAAELTARCVAEALSWGRNRRLIGDLASS